MEERRSSPRIPLRRQVNVHLSDGSTLRLWTVDISAGGLSLLSDYGADLGHQLLLDFKILDPRVDLYVPVRVRSEVANLVYDGMHGCFRIGWQFRRFLEGQDALDRYLDEAVHTKRFLR